MRVALISDLHGNLVALEAVVADLVLKGPDQVVCLGDVAALGPQPVETLRRVQGLGCPVVMGNADAFQLDPQRDPGAEGFWAKIEDIDMWGAAELGPDDRAFMETFEPTVRVEGDGMSLLCFHGTPDSYDDKLFSWSSPEEFEAALGSRSEDVFAGGHVHFQYVRRHGAATMVNPGSVGLAYQPAWPLEEARNAAFAEYAIVTLSHAAPAIETYRIPYPVDDVVDAILSSGMPHAEEWAGEWRAGAGRA